MNNHANIDEYIDGFEGKTKKYLAKSLPWTDTSIPCNPEIVECPLGLAVGGAWVFSLTR